VKVKKEVYKSFCRQLGFNFGKSYGWNRYIIGEIKEFGALAVFKINNEKMKMLTKNMRMEDQKELIAKTGFQI